MNHVPSKIVLSPELEQFADSDKISANKGNYREFDWNPDVHEQRALERVREMLLGINLSHATASEPDSIRRDGILPFDNLVGKCDWRSQTHVLDESLGLHRYTFSIGVLFIQPKTGVLFSLLILVKFSYRQTL